MPGNLHDGEDSLSFVEAQISGLGGYASAPARLWPKQELSGELGRVVIGKTGIPGRFDVALKWMPGTGAPLTNDGTNGSVDSGPSIFTATQEQLGLKLESSEGRCRFSSSIIGRRQRKIRGAI
jgi:hypothetical protein